jgi:peptide methionine sulfoxide reductase MsrA
VKAYVERMNETATAKRRRPIATKIRNPSKTRFTNAERYHQNYNKKNAFYPRWNRCSRFTIECWTN